MKKNTKNKEEKRDFKEINKEVRALKKEYAKKHDELDREYFDKVKEIIPEDKMPKWMKDVKAEDFPKPFFLMEEEDFDKIKEKRKEHFEKIKEENPLFKLFEMFAPDNDEDDEDEDDED